MFRGLSWKLFLGNALLVGLALASTAWIITAETARVHNEDVRASMRREARALALAAHADLAHPAPEEVARFLAELEQSGATAAILNSDGAELAPKTSKSAVLLPDSVRSRVLADGEAELSLETPGGIREGFAVRVGAADAPRAIVVLARAPWQFASDPRSLRVFAISIALIAVVSTVALAFGLIRLWSRPLQQIIAAARSLSRGDLTARADSSAQDELGHLARVLNRMRERLVNHVELVDGQRRTLESLLIQLHEGVVVAGPDGRIALLNPAAVRLLNLAAPRGSTYEGMAVERCIPQRDLQRMLVPSTNGAWVGGSAGAAGASGSHGSEPLLLEARLQVEGSGGTIHLLAHASDITLPQRKDDKSTPPGRLLVLTDVTALTRTIQIKTDFVANASHELRTPLSTIRAAVETLQRMNLAEDKHSAEKFLEVIDRQSGRLEALASDLLDLAKMESASDRLLPETLSVRDVVRDLYQQFAQQLSAKKLNFETECAECSSTVWAHPQLLRLVLDNLMDNAVKFTDPGGHIRVMCKSGPGWFAFHVIDTGCGIRPEDQERVFERFFQVERARSGHERGTGLGLSIVRHALAAMNGTVRLESEPGVGTSVIVSLAQPTSPVVALEKFGARASSRHT